MVEVIDLIKDNSVLSKTGLWMPSRVDQRFHDGVNGLEQAYERDCLVYKVRESYTETRSSVVEVPNPFIEGDIVHVKYNAIDNAIRNGRLFEVDGKTIAFIWFKDVVCIIRDGIPVACGSTIIVSPSAAPTMIGDIEIPEVFRKMHNTGEGTVISVGYRKWEAKENWQQLIGSDVMFKANTEYRIMRDGQEWWQLDMDDVLLFRLKRDEV